MLVVRRNVAILEVRGVSKRFGGLVAVNNVDLDIEKGEILGLIGPNGSGKTTLFNCITGFYRPESGTIRFHGENFLGLTPHETCRKGVARTFQLVKPFSRITALDNVIVGALCRTNSVEEARLEAMIILNFLGLSKKMTLPARDLTIADQKRLELARALATKPRLLLLDEVVAGLNPKETDEALALLRKIQESGVTLFVVEHVMKAIMSLADRIIVLHHGSKIAEGAPSEIATNREVIEAYLGSEYRA